MSRRRDQHRVPVQLDASAVPDLGREDVTAILRGAEDLIARGGRTLLCKVLRGSLAKDVTERALDRNPAWGFYRAMPEKEILARIDWMILRGYLRIEYFDRLPLLTYTPAGLEIEIDAVAEEWLATLRAMTESRRCEVAIFDKLREAPRATIDKLLEKVAATRDPRLIPPLTLWTAVAYRKVRAAINRTIETLRARA